MRLRDRVTIQQLVSEGQDDEGGRQTTPSTIVAGLPCAFEPLPATENRVVADQLTTEDRCRVRIRRRDDVRPGHLAVVTHSDTGVSETWHIASVLRSKDGRESYLQCSAVQA